MNPTLSTIGLRLQLAIRRLGWANALAILLLLLACCGFFGVLPELRAHDVRSRIALEQARKSLAQPQAVAALPAQSPTEQHLQAFRDLLGESRFAEQQIKTLFSIAAKNNLSLSQGEYKLLHEKNGGFDAYAIVLPVHGQYGAIRTFCQQVLLAVPFASLDQVDFKREAVNNSNLEAKLRFTLYLDHSSGSGSIAGREEAIE